MIGYASDLIVLSVSVALTAGFFIYDLKGMGGFLSQQCYEMLLIHRAFTDHRLDGSDDSAAPPAGRSSAV